VFTQQPAAATGQPSWSSVLGGGMGAVGGSVFPQLGQQQQCIHQLMLPGTAGQQGIGGGGGADGCNQLIPNCSVLINGLPSNPFSAIGGQLVFLHSFMVLNNNNFFLIL
jgi:hypothetical protein